MEKYIPETNKDLICRMKQEEFKGKYSVKKGEVVWQISKEVCLHIRLHYQDDLSFISFQALIDNCSYYLFDEEINIEDLFGCLKELNLGENAVVIEKHLFKNSATIYWENEQQIDSLNFKKRRKPQIYKF